MSTSGFYEYKWQNTPMLTQQKWLNIDQYVVVTKQNKPIHE
jgi:hypothetical protein